MTVEETKLRITYLGHSGFQVQTGGCTLIFDYSDMVSDGIVPDWDRTKPLYVFVSHKHQDHYSRKIFEWEEPTGNVTYLLSNDIKMSAAYMERIGIPEPAREHIYFLGRRKKYRLRGGLLLEQQEDLSWSAVKPRPEAEEPSAPFLEIETYRSTDAGTAFLVELEGKTLYHAGDLNLWTWQGEDEKENRAMTARYEEEIGRLNQKHIDVAFLALDSRQGEEDFWRGMDYFMRVTDTRMAFPMHCWGDYSVISWFKEMDCSLPYRDRIVMVSDKEREF